MTDIQRTLHQKMHDFDSFYRIKPRRLYVGRSTWDLIRMGMSLYYFDLSPPRQRCMGLEVYIVDADDHLEVGGDL